MKLLIPYLFVATLLASALSAQNAPTKWGDWPLWGDQKDGTYRNPVLPGDYSDLDCIRVGSNYYAISSTFQYSPGMVILQSQDLVNWSIVGHAINDLTEISPELNWDRMNRYARGVWAGAIRYHDGKFWVYFGTPDEGYFMTTATDPAGPWAPLHRMIGEAGWDDCCPFWDDDGQGYFVGTKFNDNYKTWLYKLTPDGRDLTTDPRVLINEGAGREANKLFKVGATYYHFYSESGSGGRYVMMQRSTSITGPYTEKRKLSHVQAEFHEPNQGGIIQTESGDWYFLTHHGHGDWEGRPASLQPVTWVDGWPILGNVGSDGIGTMVWGGDKPVTGTPVVVPQSSDDFSGPKLGLQWSWNYQPRQDKWSLTERPGYLRLRAFMPLRTNQLKAAGNTLTQRSMRTSNNVATLALDISNIADGQVAGLCHYSGDTSTFDVRREGNTVTLESSRGGTFTVGPSLTSQRIWLRSTWGLDGLSRYSFSTDGTIFTRFGDPYQLSWGDYRGDRIGIFTYNNKTESGYVDCDSFVYDYNLPAEPAATPPPVYVFATFMGDSATDMKLRIFTSPDAVNYTLYADTGYGGPTGSLRDPSIMKHTDGRYYLVFTAPPYNNPYAYQNFVGLAWSTDLQTWNTLPNISTTGIPGVKVSWAPEWVVDGSGVPKFIVNCSSTDSDLRPYLYTATNSDLTSWSGPVDIGIGAMHLDTQVLKEGDTWHCFTKSSLLKHATAPAITGPWTWLPDRSDWAHMEGPCAVQLTDGSWVMYVDPMYDVAQYMTSPDLTNWSSPIYVPNAGSIKHGTIIREDAFNFPPSGLRATTDNASVTLQWNAFGGAAFYNVKRSLTSGGPYTLIANVTGTTFTDSNVAYGATYYYVVSMNNGGAESADSPPVSAEMASTAVSLVHRYNFSETSGTNVADSVGGSAWNGTLPNGGTLGGGQAQLRASGSQYVRLPAGILGDYTAMTIEAWVTFPTTLPNNCFFFGFGNTSGGSGSSYIFCQPKNGRLAITPSNWAGEQNTAPNPSANWSGLTNLHVTAVFNPSQGRLTLYTNGVLAAENASVSTPLSAINNVFSYIGRSLYSGDPYFDFNLDEFRIYSGALSPSDVAATHALGPDQLITPPPAPSGLNVSANGTTIQLSWTGVPEATSYTIKRATSPGGTFTTIAVGIPATSYSDSPTADGSTYYYVVTGSNSGGESANSTSSSTTLYSDYQQWKIESGLPVDIADTATPGPDGVPVLLKYALGTAPGAAVNAPATPVATSAKGISFTRLSPARAIFAVQASSDFFTWADIATLPYGSDSWTGPATVAEDTTVTPRQVTVYDDPAFNAETKRFFRLQVRRIVP